MKKRVYLLVAMVGIGALCFAGCGKNNAADPAYDFKTSKYVKLGDYKELTVQYPIPTVTEEDIEMSITDLLDENTEYNEVSGRTAQAGDYVSIDFVGTIDGEEFEGGSAEDYEFTLGEAEFLEEFESNIIGKNTGETVTFRMTFPEDYDEELEGKEAEFTVTLNSISEAVTPEYNDELVAEATDYDTTADYEAFLNEDLMNSAKEESEATTGEDALLKAIENATISDYPKELYNACLEETEQEYRSYAEMFGMEFDAFMTDFMGGETVDSIAKTWVDEILVCQAIAEKEGFAITEENYKEAAEAFAEENEYESVEELESEYSKVYIIANSLREKTIDYLYENAKIEEVSQEEYYGEEETEDTEAE